MNKKRIILFDIDKTIYNTDHQAEDFDKLISDVLGRSDVVSLKDSNDDRQFSPEVYTKRLCDKYNFENQDKLLEVFYGDKYKHIYRDNVFPETRIVLDKLKCDYQLGIYSEATHKFQTHKFKSTGLEKYFEKDLVFILDAKDTEGAIKNIPEGAMVVDNNERICEFLTEHGIKAIWLNKKDDRVSLNFQTIHNLLELPSELM
jgi:FMN phosphatase YigB (HAD superfamily)